MNNIMLIEDYPKCISQMISLGLSSPHGVSAFECTGSRHIGYVYVAEVDDLVKIGKTRDPITRLQTLDRTLHTMSGTRINRVAVSVLHVQYSETETLLHKHFSEYRKHGEMFDVKFEDVVDAISNMSLMSSTSEIESEIARSMQSAEDCCEMLKHLLFDTDSPMNQKPHDEETENSITDIVNGFCEVLVSQIGTHVESCEMLKGLIVIYVDYHNTGYGFKIGVNEDVLYKLLSQAMIQPVSDFDSICCVSQPTAHRKELLIPIRLATALCMRHYNLCIESVWNIVFSTMSEVCDIWDDPLIVETRYEFSKFINSHLYRDEISTIFDAVGDPNIFIDALSKCNYIMKG